MILVDILGTEFYAIRLFLATCFEMFWFERFVLAFMKSMYPNFFTALAPSLPPAPHFHHCMPHCGVAELRPSNRNKLALHDGCPCGTTIQQGYCGLLSRSGGGLMLAPVPWPRLIGASDLVNLSSQAAPPVPLRLS